MVRIVVMLVALVLFTVAGVLGYVAVIAIRRSEGVFMPAGYAALACAAGGALLLRAALHA